MLCTITKSAACRTSLAGVGRVDVFNSDANGLRLVGNKRLQLGPRPAVQTGAHALTGLDPLTDVGQILHSNRTAFVSYCFRDNGLTNFVVYVSDMASFAAGDFTEQLTCALRAVALKAPTKGKELVAVVSEFTTTKELSSAHGGDVVFAKIKSDDGTGVSLLNFREFKYQVKEELTLTANQFGFLGEASFKEAFLELSQLHRDKDPSLSGEQGNGVAFNAVGSFVEVDRSGVSEADHRPSGLLELWVVGDQGFVGLRYGGNGVAGHLGAEIWDDIPDAVISEMVKCNTVTARVSNSKRYNHITGTGKLTLKERQAPTLFRRCDQFYADGAFHSASSFDVSGSLDVSLDRFGTDVTGSTHVVRGRPEVTAPQSLL